MAIASTKMTIEANLEPINRPTLSYLVDDGLSSCIKNKIVSDVDLIICNPPFHQQYVVGDMIAWQMFQQSQKVLKKGGELWVVGNRHLAYHLKLKKIFANQKLIATNNKFVILKAINYD
jgi:16S rRNA G1207 methylase RsmC